MCALLKRASGACTCLQAILSRRVFTSGAELRTEMPAPALRCSPPPTAPRCRQGSGAATSSGPLCDEELALTAELFPELSEELGLVPMLPPPPLRVPAPAPWHQVSAAPQGCARVAAPGEQHGAKRLLPAECSEQQQQQAACSRQVPRSPRSMPSASAHRVLDGNPAPGGSGHLGAAKAACAQPSVRIQLALPQHSVVFRSNAAAGTAVPMVVPQRSPGSAPGAAASQLLVGCGSPRSPS